LVCTNGLIIDAGRAEPVRIPHLGYASWMVESAAKHLSAELPKAFEQRERWRKVVLQRDARLAFADAAIPLRVGSQYSVEPDEVLRPRRHQQADFSLWSILNSVQEHIIRGGVRQVRADGTCIRSRPVRSLDEEVRINRELWRLAAELEKAVN